MVRFSRIVSTGSYLPEKILTNRELEKMVDTTDEWIQERTGIQQRHIAKEGETGSALAEQASQLALKRANLSPHEIELIVVATATPDYHFPSTACILQEKLGAQGCPSFDVGAACSGFIYALSVADQFIKTGMVNNALVVGAETFSRLVDWTDRSTCVLFGDGAGAVVLEASDQPGIHSTHLHADGRYKEFLYAPTTHQGEKPPYIQMMGREVFKGAVNALDRMVAEVLEHNHIDQSEIDWLVPHQANVRIISMTAKKLNLPIEKVVLTLQHHGNTSAASIPLALDEAITDGRIQRGHKVLLEAFGAGFAWGSALVTY